MLHLALESISQQFFETLMQKLVLTPAGMKSSTFDNSFFLSDPSTIAIPYNVDDRPHIRAPRRSPILSTRLMSTTASDFARLNLLFTRALQSGDQLIDKSLAEQLILPSPTATSRLGFFIGNRYAQFSSLSLPFRIRLFKPFYY